jgi:hypothetical protein
MEQINDVMTNVHAVGGSSYSAMCHEETGPSKVLQDKFTLTDPTLSLKEAAERIAGAISWHYSALADVDSSTKYKSSLTVANLAGGALSVEPLFGRFIMANVDNKETAGVFRADGKNSHMYSSSSSTTLGSPNIDTVSGLQANPLATEFPSSFFTPIKQWIPKFLPLLADRRLVYIALVEGILILLAKVSKDKRTASEQISQVDLATIIVDNQEIENEMLGA